MTRRDALHIVEMIHNGWPQQTPWTEGQMLAYAEGIEDLDAEPCTHAVTRAQKELRWRPSVAELREYARVERRVEERWREQPPEAQPRPAWVLRYERARAAGDQRVFPEQALAMREMGYATPDAPHTDAAVWVQPGEYDAA